MQPLFFTASIVNVSSIFYLWCGFNFWILFNWMWFLLNSLQSSEMKMFLIFLIYPCTMQACKSICILTVYEHRSLHSKVAISYISKQTLRCTKLYLQISVNKRIIALIKHPAQESWFFNKVHKYRSQELTPFPRANGLTPFLHLWASQNWRKKKSVHSNRSTRISPMAILPYNLRLNSMDGKFSCLFCGSCTIYVNMHHNTHNFSFICQIALNFSLFAQIPVVLSPKRDFIRS